jgi:hypothetical protein
MDTTDSDDPQVSDSGSVSRVGRPRRRGGAVLAAALVLAAVAASAAASAALSQPTPVPVEADLQHQIDDMLAAGMPADHPKVQLLQEQLDQVRAGADVDAPDEPGADVAAALDEAQAEEAAEDAGTASRAVEPAGDAATTAEPAWESGTVECEPIPGLLTAAEVSGAMCVSIPQPDGTSRYVAVGRDGTVRSVLFGPDGDVRRLDDVTAGRPVPTGSTAEPTREGDLVVTPPDDAAVSIDVR